MVGDRTRLSIDGRASYQRHTRLDMDYLTALTTWEVLDGRPSQL